MKTDRKVKYVILMSLVVTVLGISVAFAAMSETLTITGSANFNPSSWNVRFKDLSSPTITGDATVSTLPTITETRISDFVLNFSKPNDTITYTFSVANEGTMDAVLSTFTISKPTCISTSQTSTQDEKLVCDNLVYTLTYEDESIINNGDLLPSGQLRKLKLTIGYLGTTVPSSSVNIKNLDISFIYTQN